MPVIRLGLLPFTAGVVVGATAHAAYPKLKEKFGPQVKETLGPIVSAALAGAGDAVGEAVRAVSEKTGGVQDAMAEAARRASHAAASARS